MVDDDDVSFRKLKLHFFVLQNKAGFDTLIKIGIGIVEKMVAFLNTLFMLSYLLHVYHHHLDMLINIWVFSLVPHVKCPKYKQVNLLNL